MVHNTAKNPHRRRAAARIRTKLSREANPHDLLRRPNLDYAALMTLPDAQPETSLADSVVEQVEIQLNTKAISTAKTKKSTAAATSKPLKLPRRHRTAKSKVYPPKQQKLNQHKTRNRRSRPHPRCHACRRRIADGAFEARALKMPS